MAYINRIYLEVNGTEVPDVQSVDVAPQGFDVKPVKTMNKNNRARGFTVGQPHWELSLKVAVPAVGEFDWEKAMIDQDDVLVVLDEGTETGGINRTTYTPARIGDVGTTSSVDGETTRTVKIVALDRVKE